MRMSVHFAAVAATVAVALTMAGAAQAQTAPGAREREQLVRQFVDAFNRQDAGAMMQMMAPNIEWWNVNGGAMASEGSTRESIGKGMRAYFAACPSCRSRLDGVIATPQRVSAIEVAAWTGKAGPTEQRSISVYEFDGPLISRVYYFPAERNAK
jgi:ketosteroid isomerase-like protein